MTSARNESHAVRLRGWRFLLAVAVAGVLALLATPSLCREAEAASPAVAPKAPTEVAARLRRDYPLDIDPIALTGTVHHLLGNSEEAVTCWQECVRRDPGRADARKHRETVKRLKAKGLPVSTGRPPASADDLATLRDGVARVHTVAGRFCHKRGNVDQAERHWRRAAEIDPTNAACRVHLAARLKVNPATTPEARRLYTALQTIEPANPMHWLNAAVIDVWAGRFDDAERGFLRVRQLAPKRSLGCAGLAQLYLRANRKLPEAKALAEEAVKLEPAASNYVILSEACDKNGDLPGACAAMNRALELEPRNVRYRRILESLKRKGQ